ncbi:DUF3077 domain-containing protein [Pseudomonas capeferrum]|uniref:DUF3077 domain-containing protein n=1 Tax=Pseudomonas capeferrum TaxID=1495066 RepID=UPI0015E48058|nr:DUF3077 domain-containing protein [Pseudomonas capeferrum]MBA1202974.1 DUF3077 domain-containing protein [Pseudomonas capeferrum]
MLNDPETLVTTGAETFSTSQDPAEELFRIQAGVPFHRALEQLPILLGRVRHRVREGAIEGDQ